PADSQVGNPVTFQIDLGRGLDALRQTLSGNWRHNLVRGERRGTRVEVWSKERPLDPVLRIYEEMCRLQKIPHAFTAGSLEAMRTCLADSLTLLVASDDSGEPVAVRGYGRFGERAYELIAAVTALGRKVYANYTLMWRVLEMAREQGVRTYDVSGADAQDAAGVYAFKKGLGGRLVRYAGEWDWANSSLLRWGINRAVRWRPVSA